METSASNSHCRICFTADSKELHEAKVSSSSTKQYQALDPWWFPTFLMEDDEHWWTMEVFTRFHGLKWPLWGLPETTGLANASAVPWQKTHYFHSGGTRGKSCTTAAYSFLWYEIIFLPTFWRLRAAEIWIQQLQALLSRFYGFHVANPAVQYITTCHNCVSPTFFLNACGKRNICEKNQHFNSALRPLAHPT